VNRAAVPAVRAVKVANPVAVVPAAVQVAVVPKQKPVVPAVKAVLQVAAKAVKAV